MAYLQFEAIGIDRIKTQFSVSFVDHNTLQTDFKNADDHMYLQTTAQRYGIYFSKPGNGICHQLFLERFARPGNTRIGSDSHTPTAGGMGCFAMGSGGLDVACAMAGAPFRIKYPKVVGIKLTGRLSPWVSAKDVILEVLRRVDVKGNVGKVFEYFGEGVATLSVPDRATITNMGTETGCTTSIFPSDEVTRQFLAAQGREQDFQLIVPDENAQYDEIIEINLSEIEPMVALPHSPGNVMTVREAGRIKVNQVAIGSCTNSSLRDLTIVAKALKGKTISNELHLFISPGSRQVVEQSRRKRRLYQPCESRRADHGKCLRAPASAWAVHRDRAVFSVRTFNRNFEGRSGNQGCQVYLVSPETAAATALTGYLTDPRDLGEAPEFKLPDSFIINDNMILAPLSPEEACKVTIQRGPNIKPLPSFDPLSDDLSGKALIRVGDNITTDHIMPAGAKILPLRSNIPEISKYVFEALDPSFHEKARNARGGFIIGGVKTTVRAPAASMPRLLPSISELRPLSLSHLPEFTWPIS
jgi:aconitate hydratase